MSFEVKYKDLAGRVGRLETRHGRIETPYVFPVINPFKQGLAPSEVAGVGFPGLITNSYLIWKRIGWEAPDVHDLLGFRGPVMTDSGAYQILRYGKVEVSPEEIVDFQRRIGSDIAVILDIPTSLDASYEEARMGVEETLRRAEMLERRDGDPLWVLPIQGGRHLDLVEMSARRSRRLLGYDVYAVGSPTGLMENYRFDVVLEMVFRVRRILGFSKPLHLFGAGHPMFLPFMVAAGVDLADSASYALYAADDRYMTPYGTRRLEDLEHLPCSCPVCSRFTAKELKSLSRAERRRLLSLHNLYVINAEVKRVKQSVAEGTLWEYLEERSRVHPALNRAFSVIKRWVGFLERYDPVRPRVVRGIFIYSEVRPETYRYYKLFKERYTLPREVRFVVLIPAPEERPYSDAPVTRELGLAIRRASMEGEVAVMFYDTPFGLVPLELSEVYPLSQNEGFVKPFFTVKMFSILRKMVVGRGVKVVLLCEPGKCGKIGRLLRGVPLTVVEVEPNRDARDYVGRIMEALGV